MSTDKVHKPRLFSKLFDAVGAASEGRNYTPPYEDASYVEIDEDGKRSGNIFTRIKEDLRNKRLKVDKLYKEHPNKTTAMGLGLLAAGAGLTYGGYKLYKHIKDRRSLYYIVNVFKGKNLIHRIITRSSEEAKIESLRYKFPFLSTIEGPYNYKRLKELNI